MIQEASNPITCNCHPPDVKISFLERYHDFLLSTNTLATVGNGAFVARRSHRRLGFANARAGEYTVHCGNVRRRRTDFLACRARDYET